jgi:hypothetical protein
MIKSRSKRKARKILFGKLEGNIPLWRHVWMGG